MFRKPGNWFRKDNGVVAVEFAMISLPFCMLLTGIVELSVFYGAAIVLEGATAEAGRLVRTGQAQEAADPEGMFREMLCDKVSEIIPCPKIQYEVIAMGQGTFGDAEMMEPQFDESGDLVPQGFDAGGDGEIVLIRAVYRYEFMTPFMGKLMAGASGGNTVTLMATTIIKNEPFEFEG